MIYDTKPTPTCVACRAEMTLPLAEKMNPEGGLMGISEAFIMGAAEILKQLRLFTDGAETPPEPKVMEIGLVMCDPHTDMMAASP